MTLKQQAERVLVLIFLTLFVVFVAFIINYRAEIICIDNNGKLKRTPYGVQCVREDK